ncbi:unnamed protein product [Camellia sinensis]
MCKRPLTTLLCMVFVIIVSLFRYVHGTSHTQPLKIEPMPPRSPINFNGFLPKSTLIPPSGPSKRHNEDPNDNHEDIKFRRRK